MASYMVHLAVAKKINEVLNKDEDMFLYGAVAPDVSVSVQSDRAVSHFVSEESSKIPNIELFLKKYKYYLSDDFVMGYFVHLYTDYLWYKYFISEIIKDGTIVKLDGSIVKLNGEMASIYIYNDYTNLNEELIDMFSIDVSKIVNYKDIKVNHVIEEIPYDKMNVLFDNINNIINNTKKRKEYVFNISNIERFIDMAVELIYSEIEDIDKIVRREEDSEI